MSLNAEASVFTHDAGPRGRNPWHDFLRVRLEPVGHRAIKLRLERGSLGDYYFNAGNVRSVARMAIRSWS
jgi:hypothetical protein